MLSLTNYLSKIGDIRWYMTDTQSEEFSKMCHVNFTKKKDYFVITRIRYSPYDILLAIEDVDFALEKRNEDINIRILKI